MKYLTCKMQPVWDEEVIDRGSETSDEFRDADSEISPKTEYTYSEETEDEE